MHGGRHAHLEQPEGALSWHTVSLRDLPGHWAAFDQCRYGVMCLDVDGEWRPVRKSTAILTTKMAMSAALQLRCQGDHVHCRVEGHAPGYGKRTKYLEDYQPSLAATIAAALMVDEPPHAWETAMAVPEHKEYTGKLAALHTEVKAEAIRTVQRLHRNLGHPSPETLTDLLSSRGASDEILTAARNYQCAACLRYKKPNQVAPASTKQIKEFGEVLQADVFWIRSGSAKFPILSVVDMATKYQVAALVHGEKEKTYYMPWRDLGFDTSDFRRSWSVMRAVVGLDRRWKSGPTTTESSMRWPVEKLTADWLWWSDDIQSFARRLRST